jgi:cytoskeletal protein RodZ
MDVGTTLRTARERRGLSIPELAATTKIPASLLAAIDDNAFARVPRGIFVRGYLRAYAREVGLEPEPIIEQFLAETGESLPVAPTPVMVESAPEDGTIEDTRIDPEFSESGPGWGYVLVVAALVVAVVSFNRETAPDASEVAAAADTTIVDQQTAAPDVRPVATTGAGLRFEIAASGPCWVEAVVDGRRVVYRLMQPGEREALDGTRDIVLRIGDPGAVTYAVNGQTGEPLGKSGTPVTVRFTSGGERQVIAS